MMAKRILTVAPVLLFLGFWLALWTAGSVAIATPKEPQQPLELGKVVLATFWWLLGGTTAGTAIIGGVVAAITGKGWEEAQR